MQGQRKPAGLHLLSQREGECQVNPGTRPLWGVSCRNQRRPQTDRAPPAGPGTAPRGRILLARPRPQPPEGGMAQRLDGPGRLTT